MSTTTEFLESLRNADWSNASELLDSGDQIDCSVQTPSSSVFNWLIELDAPSNLVVKLVQHCVSSSDLDADRLGLLETCMRLSNTKANAFETFRKLLTHGLSPNVIADGGATLLQKAMEHNKTREVRELLLHGIDPHQMSVFGIESTSNLEEAKQIGNEACELVLSKFATT